MIGTNQLPKPPIIAGMTMKKIMISPWGGGEHVEELGIAEDLHARLHELKPHGRPTALRR